MRTTKEIESDLENVRSYHDDCHAQRGYLRVIAELLLDLRTQVQYPFAIRNAQERDFIDPDKRDQ